MILRREDHSVLQLFQDAILEELHLSSGNVKEEHTLSWVDAECDVIAFTNGETLNPVRKGREVVANEPTLTTVADMVDIELHSPVVRLALEIIIESCLPGTENWVGDKNRRRVEMFDQFEGGGSVAEEDGRMFGGDVSGGGLGWESDDPIAEGFQIVSLALARCNGESAELLVVPIFATVVSSLDTRSSSHLKMSARRDEASNSRQALSLMEDDETL